MTRRFEVGDQVVALKDFGGLMRESVPKGARGVVTRAGSWSTQPKVLFTIEGPFSRRQVEVEVRDDEI